jgi:hypothetical protein
MSASGSGQRITQAYVASNELPAMTAVGDACGRVADEQEAGVMRQGMKRAFGFIRMQACASSTCAEEAPIRQQWHA